MSCYGVMQDLLISHQTQVGVNEERHRKTSPSPTKRQQIEAELDTILKDLQSKHGD